MRIHFGTLILAWLIAMVLWGMSHGTSSIERPVDIPVVFDGVPDDLVITGQSADSLNIRVLGSRAAVRNVSPTRMDYRIDVAGSKSGVTVHEVDDSRIELPRGARIVSRSPASIEIQFEKRGRKAVRVRPDLEGEPAAGFVVTNVSVEPARVWLTGARSAVLRLSEVVTETMAVAGLTESVEREARLSLGSEHVWMEKKVPVKVRIEIAPLPVTEEEQGNAPPG